MTVKRRVVTQAQTSDDADVGLRVLCRALFRLAAQRALRAGERVEHDDAEGCPGDVAGVCEGQAGL